MSWYQCLQQCKCASIGTLGSGSSIAGGTPTLWHYTNFPALYTSADHSCLCQSKISSVIAFYENERTLLCIVMPLAHLAQYYFHWLSGTVQDPRQRMLFPAASHHSASMFFRPWTLRWHTKAHLLGHAISFAMFWMDLLYRDQGPCLLLLFTCTQRIVAGW